MLRALAKDPEARFQTASEMAAALAAGRDPSASAVPGRGKRRYLLYAAAGATALPWGGVVLFSTPGPGARSAAKLAPPPAWERSVARQTRLATAPDCR